MIRVARQGAAAAELLAALHGRSFQPGWDAAAMAALLAGPQTFALIAETATEASGDFFPAGLALFRVAAGEGEILTLGVNPEWRRSGVGRALLDAALASLRACSAAQVFLEVAANNRAAIALYEGMGFRAVGRRKGYYAVPGGTVDALVLARMP